MKYNILPMENTRRLENMVYLNTELAASVGKNYNNDVIMGRDNHWNEKLL